MDTFISQEKISQRKRKKIYRISLYLSLSITIILALAVILKPAIHRKEIKTSIVDKGVLEMAIGAVGSAVPFYEEIITSPVNSKILAVYKKSGEQLSIGDTILKLDLSAATASLDKEWNELQKKRLQFEQFQSNVKTQLAEINSQIKVEEMKQERMEILLRNEYYLDSIGASTPDKIMQVKLDYDVQVLTLKNLKVSYENKKKIAESDLKILQLEMEVAEKNFKLKQKEMGDAQLLSPSNGVLRWVNDQIGASVSTGNQLAIVSDMSNYKIIAEISDSYAARLTAGMYAEILIGETKLTGVVNNIVPSVSNGMLSFTINLNESNSQLLRPGLNVEIYVIYAIKNEVMRIQNNTFYKGPGQYDLWVINDGTAQTRKVTLGENSPQYIEVVKGLETGDEVIVSNMSRFKNKKKVKVKK